MFYKRYHPDIGTGGFCPGGFVLGGYCPGGYCPEGYCPDTEKNGHSDFGRK